MTYRITLAAGILGLCGVAPLHAQEALPPDKLVVLIGSGGCDFGKLSAKLSKAGRAMARDRRTLRVNLDWPADPSDNRDMLGRASPIIAALEVSAARDDLRKLARKVSGRLEGVCKSDSYVVHERRLMTSRRSWELGEPSPIAKVLTTLVRKPGITRVQFIGEWTGTHAELSLAWRRARGGPGHYVQNIVVEAVGEDAPELDGIGEIEGPGTGKVSEAERMARMETAAHARTFQDMDDTAMFVAREVILKD